MEEAREREEETRKLHEELAEARLEMEIKEKALIEARNAPPQIITVVQEVKQEKVDTHRNENSLIVIENGSDSSSEDGEDRKSEYIALIISV